MFARLNSWCSRNTNSFLIRPVVHYVVYCSWELSIEPHSQYPLNKFLFCAITQNQPLLLTTENLNGISYQLACGASQGSQTKSGPTVFQ